MRNWIFTFHYFRFEHAFQEENVRLLFVFTFHYFRFEHQERMKDDKRAHLPLHSTILDLNT